MHVLSGGSLLPVEAPRSRGDLSATPEAEIGEVMNAWMYLAFVRIGK